MLQAVHSNLESALLQHLSYVIGHTVFAFWHKVEARPKSVSLFEVHQLLDARHAFAAFDVMSEDQGKALTVWPAWPSSEERRLLSDRSAKHLQRLCAGDWPATVATPNATARE